jgi:hypothetical protein
VEGGTALKRADAKRHGSHKPAPTQPAVPIGATDREIRLSLDRDELLGLMQDSLESLALKPGMEATARWLERINPDAASSLREGLEETLAVVRLGLAGVLRRTLATTNPPPGCPPSPAGPSPGSAR